MLNKKLALEVINLAASTGADFVEIFYEDTYSSSLSLENGKVDNVANGNTNGIGLRLLKGNRSVYGSTNDLSRKGLLALATNLSKSFSGERILNELTEFETVHIKNISPVKRSLKEVTTQEKIDFLQIPNKLIKEFDPRIVRVGSADKNLDQDRKDELCIH